MKRLYILGVNGNARDVLDAVMEIRRRDSSFPEPAGFLDDGVAEGTIVDGLPVHGRIEVAAKLANACFVNAIGSPESYPRKPLVIERTGVSASAFATVVHPAACVSRSAQVGRGSVILSHVSVGAGARIGDHVMVLQNGVISHDSRIDDYAVLAAGMCLSGGVRVGRCAYVGAQACVRNNIEIGEESLVGMGSVVVKPVPSHEVWCGNPARKLR
ncbi:MAG: NeuD/PglB/VioB family sugar acetyltransferase [Verrucomicrobia bacterium]|nr:NeuD/PglB/VioB family sugar acetyltransferase [Verrucomicrobiota bacterium]